MRAAVIHDPDAPAGVAKGDELLAQQHEAERRSVRRELARDTGGYPIFAHEPPHRRAGSDARQNIVVLCRSHRFLLWVAILGAKSIIAAALAPRRRARIRRAEKSVAGVKPMNYIS